MELLKQFMLFRKIISTAVNYAGKGHTYDQTRDAFIAPKPHPSWVLDEDTCWWKAPVPHPDDDKRYKWNEDGQSWDLDELE